MFWDRKHLVFFPAFNSLSEGIFNVPKQLGHTLCIMNSTLIEGSHHCIEKFPVFFLFLLLVHLNSFPLLSQLSQGYCWKNLSLNKTKKNILKKKKCKWFLFIVWQILKTTGNVHWNNNNGITGRGRLYSYFQDPITFSKVLLNIPVHIIWIV